jgi:peptidoglycan/LPS O-acetylase OafA/YrhL
VPQHPEFLEWRDLPSELFLVQAFGVPGGEGWNSPTWTLSALMGCYLLFPPLWRAQAKIKSPGVVLAIVVGFVVLCDLASRRFAGVPIYEFTSKVGIVRAVPLFLLGAALARVSEATWIAPRSAVVATYGAAAALIGLQFAGQFDVASIIAISIMVVGAGAVPSKHPSRLLKTAALVSFAIFITNEFVRSAYVGVLHALTHGRVLSPAAAWASWWGALAFALIFAVIFHYVVDMPTQRLIKRLRKPAPAKAAQPSQGPAEAAA